MENGYYSVESILAEAQTVQATFKVPLRGYGPALSGELEQEGNPDVPSGHEMRLPFWMAKVLKGKEAVDLKLPRHFEYKGKFRQQLALDPSRMNLREKDPRFFLRGAQLAGFVDEQERDSLRVDLKNAYAERYKTTVDSAATATDGEYSTAVRPLDATDEELFNAGRQVATKYREWKQGSSGRLEAAAVIKKNRRD